MHPPRNSYSHTTPILKICIYLSGLPVPSYANSPSNSRMQDADLSLRESRNPRLVIGIPTRLGASESGKTLSRVHVVGNGTNSCTRVFFGPRRNAPVVAFHALYNSFSEIFVLVDASFAKL
eukprot:3186445-Rhodomonas_salina.1